VKKLVATISGVAAALAATCLAYSPPAAGGPACPYDMSTRAGQSAMGQQVLDYTQRASATHDVGDLNALNNLTYACIDGYSQQPNPQQQQYPQMQLIAPLPDFNPGPLQPVPTPPLIVDSYTPPSSGVDCTKLRAAYDSLGPVASTADAVAKLNHIKIPGVSQVTGTSLALCALDAIPNAIGNPSPANQQRVFDGGCGAVDEVTGGIINPCGDTTAGSN
jgi:hypothetical protein